MEIRSEFDPFIPKPLPLPPHSLLFDLFIYFQGVLMTKRTFQPNIRRRAKKHGFRARMATRAGRAVLSARRAKGRARISA